MPVTINKVMQEVEVREYHCDLCGIKCNYEYTTLRQFLHNEGIYTVLCNKCTSDVCDDIVDNLSKKYNIINEAVEKFRSEEIDY